MDSSESAQDLERAIMELDGMYNDLNESYRRHSQGQISRGELPQFQSSDDDEDYDVPRPAEGLFNTTPKPRVKPWNIVTEEEEHYQVLPKSPTRIDEPIMKSPSTPPRSEHSSGLGTLPKENYGPPFEAEFPGPPEFEVPPPPSLHLTSSDSDYDEVASTSSSSSSSGESEAEDIVYSHPSLETRRKSSESSNADYAVIQKSGNEVPNDVIVLDDPSAQDGGPDYAEVYSPPTSQRSSTVVREVVHDLQTDEEIPMVVQMKRIDRPSVKFENETNQQRKEEEEEHSFITPRVQIKSVSPEKERKVPGYAHNVTDSKVPVDENSNIENEARQSISYSTTSAQEPTLPYRPRSFRNESKKKKAMDAEARKQKQSNKGPKCPCKCRACVPLMAVTVILCIAVFMVIVIGYVYVGITNDQLLANSRSQGNEIPPGSVNSTTSSGDGV